jgi:hypothetical protein
MCAQDEGELRRAATAMKSGLLVQPDITKSFRESLTSTNIAVNAAEPSQGFPASLT